MNDFASSLKIPRIMTEAADMIVRGRFRGIDAGLFNGSRFAYVAAFGAFTEVSYSTDRQLKSFFGTFAYFLEGMKLGIYPQRLSAGWRLIPLKSSCSIPSPPQEPRKKLLLVYNPFSGKGGILRSLPDIISLFTADGYDVSL